MKILTITILSILLSLNAFAAKSKNKYKSISTHSTDNPKKPLKRSDIMDRLMVTATVYVTSADGTQLFHDVSEAREWNLNGKENFESTWMSDSDKFGSLAIKQKWFLNHKNQLVASIAQYEPDFSKSDSPPKMGKLISTKEFIITNFSPFTLDMQLNGNKKTVVRFSPSLRPEEKVENDISNFPVKAKKLVAFDNKGKIWVESVDFSGKFVSLTTHEGTVSFSFFPFKGSKEIGMAENGQIKLKINKKHSLTLISTTPFLPQGMKTRVFGFFKLKEKSSKPRSVLVRTSDKFEEFELDFKIIK